MKTMPHPQLDLHCSFADGVAEYRFHPERKWRFDWAWPSIHVAIEYEGGTWSRGAHVRGAHFSSDCEKYNAAQIRGWKVFRLTADMLRTGQHIPIMEYIRTALAGKDLQP